MRRRSVYGPICRGNGSRFAGSMKILVSSWPTAGGCYTGGTFSVTANPAEQRYGGHGEGPASSHVERLLPRYRCARRCRRCRSPLHAVARPRSRLLVLLPGRRSLSVRGETLGARLASRRDPSYRATSVERGSACGASRDAPLDRTGRGDASCSGCPRAPDRRLASGGAT